MSWIKTQGVLENLFFFKGIVFDHMIADTLYHWICQMQSYLHQIQCQRPWTTMTPKPTLIVFIYFQCKIFDDFSALMALNTLNSITMLTMLNMLIKWTMQV